VIGLALAVWLTLGLIPPSRPDPVPASAPAGIFSSERAMAHVRQIAQRPHPVLSADHDRVRDYIRAPRAGNIDSSRHWQLWRRFEPR